MTMTLGQHQQKFAKDIVTLLVYAFTKGYEARLGEFERPLPMQELYFKTGRSKTMDSKHLKKCAGDIHFFKDGKLCYPEEIGRKWEELDTLNKAGMFWKNFKDSPHLERSVK
jgi:hypothetical protein